MGYIIFGNASAENDNLLYDCKIIKDSTAENSQILVGRWGTGKSAILLLQNEKQSKILKDLHGIEHERIWLFKETSLNLKALSDLRITYGNDRSALQRAIEEIWKSEITRVYCRLLTKLKSVFKLTSGNHWHSISQISDSAQSIDSIWNHVPQLISAVTHDKKNIPTDYINKISSFDILDNLNACLRDISEGELIPCVAIEPIETPDSEIEKQEGIAQIVVSALLNTFRNHFEPNYLNNYKCNVRISIPWHRYIITDGADFPQKLSQYRGIIKWGKPDLKNFINKRIDAEFKRVKRRILSHDKEPWDILFPEKLENRVCDPYILEDSFDYFLRHTHYRPRDLQTLVRKCVQYQATNQNISEDEILKFYTLSETSIKDTFRKECRLLGDELIEEGDRRDPKLKILANSLRGLRIPFDTETLKKRISDKDIHLNEAFDLLWNIGIIGLSAIPSTNEISQQLIQFFTTEHQKIYSKKEHQKSERWVWFEYNYEGHLIDLKDKMQQLGFSEEDLSLKLIIHPKMFENLLITINDKDAPIGI